MIIMLSKNTSFGLFFFTCVAAAFLWGTSHDDPAKEIMETIRAEDLKSDLYFLASDEMKGRDISTAFNEIASLYLAHRFERMGLLPGGKDNTYFQYFTLVQSQLSETNRLEITHEDSPLSTIGRIQEDFCPALSSANKHLTAPVVFVGYGITSPEHNYDDYDGVDVRGKVAFLIDHEPGERDLNNPFDSLLNSKHSHEVRKLLNAQRQGAVAAIIMRDDAKHPSKIRSNRQPRSSPLPRRTRLPSRRRTQSIEFSQIARRLWPEDASRLPCTLQIWTDAIRIPAIYVSPRIAHELLKNQQLSLDQIQESIDAQYKPQSFPLEGMKATIKTSITRKQVRIRNVLAYLPGSDPKLRNEVVVVGAHLDHVGVRQEEIYNGADDDASGMVGVLEIAEAFANSPRAARRSLLFAVWNAEEHGLLGSYYYVAHPTFPIGQTVAMFQMDMIGRSEEILDPGNRLFRGLQKQSAKENLNSVNVLGYSRSENLMQVVTENNQRIGLDLKFRYDNHIQNLLQRSDHWPFLISGVPAIFFTTGLHPDYHTPQDTPDKINYGKLERIVRLVFLSIWTTANTTTPPMLNPSILW